MLGLRSWSSPVTSRTIPGWRQQWVPFRDGLSGYFAKLEADQTLAAKLRKKGFKIDTTNRRVYLPIVIKADLLAKALPSDDKFDEAMAPVREATELGIAAKSEIDALLKLVRG